MLQWAGRAKRAHGTLRLQHAKANECQTGKRYCLWEIHSVPLDLPWSFNAVSLSLLSRSPTHLPLLIISCSLERQGRDGETDSTISDSISWLCTSCPWASPLPVALVPLMSACQKNEWYAGGNNPVCKINLREMGFLTCRLNITDYCVWLSLLLALSTCIFLTLSIITPHPQKPYIYVPSWMGRKSIFCKRRSEVLSLWGVLRSLNHYKLPFERSKGSHFSPAACPLAHFWSH